MNQNIFIMQNFIITTPHELKTLILDVFKEHQLLTPKTENTPLNGEETAKKYYSRKETAEQLNITLPTLNKYVKNGIIKSHRIGNRVLFKVLDIENALTNRKF
jgi:excisionase family DNA binding protein